jgi:hypothetical protein
MTCPTLYAIGALEIGGETTFGTEAVNYETMRIVGQLDRSSLTKASIVDEHVRYADYDTARIPGAANGTLVTRIYAAGYSATKPTAAPSLVGAGAVDPKSWDLLMAMFASATGGVVAGGYVDTTVLDSSGAPVDTLLLTATDAASFTVGQAVAWTVPNGGEVGWVTSKATSAGPADDELGLLQAPHHEPTGAVDDVVLYGGYTIVRKTGDNYHCAGFTDAAASFSLRHVDADGMELVALGCRPTSCRFTATVNELPTFEITWSVAHWSETKGATLAAQAYAYPLPESVSQWLVRYGSGATVEDLIAASIEIDWQIETTPLVGGYGESGIEGHVTVRRRPIVTMTLLRDVDRHDVFLDQSEAPLQIQIGSQPGKLIAFALPLAHLAEYPLPMDDAGKLAQQVTFYPVVYTGDTGSEGAKTLIDTDFRLAFL